MSQKLISLFEINASTFRGYKLEPRSNSKGSPERKIENFWKWGLHFIHYNLNRLLPKIDEQLMPVVIGITETKIDNSIHT